MRTKLACIPLIAMLFSACYNANKLEMDYPLTPDPQPACITVDFDSYEEYLSFFSGASTTSANDDSMEAMYGEDVANYVDSIASGETLLVVPHLDNAPIPLRTEEGYSAVTYFPRELYNLPWTWFHAYIGDDLISIHISELDDDTADLASGKTCSEFLSEFAPSAPNIHNYDTFENYSAIYEDTFSVCGTTVCGLIQETTDGKTYTSFLIDGCLISISAPSDAVTDEWLERLSFVRI